MRLQTINGEQFNVDAIQRIIGRAMREAYPSDRAMIEVVSRLINAYREKAAQDELAIRSLVEHICDLQCALEDLKNHGADE
jgi:hypothetical protein